MTSASARPSEPRAGSLTSMSPAPPSRATSASEAERTLTRSWVSWVVVASALFMGDGRLHGDRNFEESKPAGVLLKGHHPWLFKPEPIQQRRFEPAGLVAVRRLVGQERRQV